MREPQILENELVELSAIQDDTTKLERIIAWCASHPDDVPLAIRLLMGRRNAGNLHPDEQS